MAATNLEESLVAKLRSLPPDQQQEVVDFADFLASKTRRPLINMYGLWKDLGISLSEEDLAEARKEMWGNFPREDFFK
jgi:hypothetical protein